MQLQPRPFGLRLYNSLTREIEEFEPLEDRRVSMYVCGITPYDVGHLGHALVYVVFDTLHRWLEHNAFEVAHVQNITDVGHMLDTGEDRILRKARQLSAKPMQVVETYMRDYFADIEDVEGVIALHEMTLAAIRTRDPAEIANAIDVHLKPLEGVIAEAFTPAPAS